MQFNENRVKVRFDKTTSIRDVELYFHRVDSAGMTQVLPHLGLELRPQALLGNGETVSIQASKWHNCQATSHPGDPHRCGNKWKSVEIGFAGEGFKRELRQAARGFGLELSFDDDEDVFGWVPKDVVELALMNCRGGIVGVMKFPEEE